MKIKTNELTGVALDWAVAKCDGLLDQWGVCAPVGFRPSTDWAQGGPIIERENISVGYQGHLGVPPDSLWYATDRGDACGFGRTPLIAAMRCFVASKLGDTAEVPDELVPAL